MRFGILGPLTVWASDGRPVRVPERKVRALLADLLVHLGGPVPADRLVDDLWGEAPPAGAANALQTKVSQLRRALEAGEVGGRHRVVLGPAGYELLADPDALDAERFLTLVGEARTNDDLEERDLRLSEALALWRGDVLTDVADASFARATIARLEEERLLALEDQAEARLALGRHTSVLGDLGDLVIVHPLRERLRALHVLALYRAGRQTEALDSFRQLRERLADELGLDPGPELVRLHQAVLEQDPSLDAASPPPRAASEAPPSPVRHGMPVPLTPLIGRDEDVTEVAASLRSHRLVTLVGPGGVGKTRLAVAVAASLAADEASVVGPACLIELAALPGGSSPSGASTSLTDVAEFVTATLGLRDEVRPLQTGTGPSSGSVDRLTAALSGRRMLMVLDNGEHLIDPVAELVHRLLADAPEVTVLVTSREALTIPGEVVHVVEPLAMPGAATTDRAALATYSATELFVARAAAASPGFALTDDNAADVAAICRRLDGVPLALELAASRVPALGTRELAARLVDRFRLLSAGKRGLPARQRTLRGVIDWSWQLLDDAERAVLRRLSVHADGCTLDGAEVVCSDRDVPVEDVAELLARLVERSLVTVTHGTESRYRLLESIAAFGFERLAEADEVDATRRRFHRYHLDLAERAEPELRGPDQRTWLGRLDGASGNLRRVLDEAIAANDGALAQRLTASLAWYGYLRGRRAETVRGLARALAVDAPVPDGVAARAGAWHAGLSMLDGGQRVDAADEVLARFDAADDPGGRARAGWLLAFAEFRFGDLASSERLLAIALAEFHRQGDEWGIAASHGLAAQQAIVRGDLPALHREAEASLQRFRALGDGWGQLHAIDALATGHEIAGRYRDAAACLEEGLEIASELELGAQHTAMRSGLGRIALLEGRYEEADELLGQARTAAREVADTAAEEAAELGLALSARRQGHLEEAEVLLRRWLAWNREFDAAYGAALILAELGFVAELRGDAVSAETLHREGHDLARATGDPRAVALALEGLAGAASLLGDHLRAARLLGNAAALRASVGAALPAGERGDVDRVTRRVRDAIGPAAFTAEFDRGGILEVHADT